MNAYFLESLRRGYIRHLYLELNKPNQFMVEAIVANVLKFTLLGLWNLFLLGSFRQVFTFVKMKYL